MATIHQLAAGGLDRVDHLVILVPDRESNLSILITIAELSERKDVLWDGEVWVFSLLDHLGREDLCELVGAWDGSADLKSDAHSLPADSDETTAQVIEVLPFEGKLSVSVGGRDSLRSHDN